MVALMVFGLKIYLCNCKATGQSLLTVISSLINLLLEDKCHLDVIQICWWQFNCASEKSGSIRLIAAGYTWRRLAAKCVNSFTMSRPSDFFAPIQLRVGISGGCESAVHVIRRFTESMPANEFVIAKLDFKNAFNNLRRDAMLEAVYKAVSEIYKFCNLSYSQ